MHAAARPSPAPHTPTLLPPPQLQVVLCSACSGHAFKMASVVGSICADLALLDGATPHDISLHRLGGGREGHAAVLTAFGGSGAAAARM